MLMMIMFGPLFSAFIFVLVFSFLFCVLSYLWWAGKRKYSF